jgi:hypothetical protein
MKERCSRLVVDEPIRIERADLGERCVLGPAEDEAQAWIGRKRCGAVELNQPDVQALVQALEEARERAVR